jgi:hypothetical protein
MLISRSLHRTIRNTSSLIPINLRTTRSINSTTKMATSQTATIPQSQRMFDGGTHKLDVWSIFTYVSFTYPSELSFFTRLLRSHTLLAYFILLSSGLNKSPPNANTQSRKRPFRLYQPRSRIHELGTTRLAPRIIP